DLFDPADRYWHIVRDLKHVFAPNHVIAPRKYNPIYSGFHVRATRVVRLRPRRPTVAGVSRCRDRGLCRGASGEGAGAPI
ncbi:MAG TPA: hypothetical protein VFZ34_08895, partial [Blastocatellia bacterium]|nr:hypothetical protein [Blastocatellia bacterium]